MHFQIGFRDLFSGEKIMVKSKVQENLETYFFLQKISTMIEWPCFDF